MSPKWSLLPLLPSLLIVACGESGDDTGADAAPVTFAELQETVLVGSCGGAGCHGPATVAGGLLLEGDDAYDSLMNDPCENELAVAEGLLRVAPGDLDKSFLYVKVTDARGMGDPMPPWDSLDDAGIAMIRQWILDGARP
ncbi:MAG: hypothetical protein D6798_17765 [Deltaproteobacteria bacterium]|nr:MAG: hypothetical protein D6798_17765 [Deltaproteobacteria bacterium]